MHDVAGGDLTSSTWALGENSGGKVATAPAAAAMAVLANVPLRGNDLSLAVPCHLWSLRFSSDRRGAGGLFAQLSLHLQGEDPDRREGCVEVTCLSNSKLHLSPKRLLGER